MVKSVHINSHTLTKFFNGGVKLEFFMIFRSILILHQFLKKRIRPTKVNLELLVPYSNFQNIFEKLIYTQINSFTEPKLSKCLKRFRKNHIKWLKHNATVGAIVTDLSQAFDTLNQRLLLCKLKAYKFDQKASTFIQSHFLNRHQRINVGDEVSIWQKISTEVAQGSILDPLFFSIFTNEIFIFYWN